MHELDETHRDEVMRDPVRDPLPIQEVERLVSLLRESGVGEIRVRQGDVEISVRAAEAERAPTGAEAATAREAGTQPPADLEEPAERHGLHEIRSPLVGTFYRAPAPGEEAYVQVGDRVRAGEILCIVEAMKLMNEIPADVSGEVVEILAENAGGVEYDQPLFYLRLEE
jgi:acetyl-CoA carboxylase biotin carboxyl carrier protein